MPLLYNNITTMDMDILINRVGDPVEVSPIRRNGNERWISELFDFCESESLSEEGLRDIIDRRGLTPNNHNLGNYKFFRDACFNERVTEGIIRCLLEYFPDAANYTDEYGCLPLHWACKNKNVTFNITQLLIAAAPNSVRGVNSYGNMPLHDLCSNQYVDEMTEIKILKFLIDKYQEAVQHADNNGSLPIHIAAGRKSPELCSVLIEAFPGSEQMNDANDRLPLHHACFKGSLATVEYLYNLFPNAINTTTTWSYYPVHAAILGIKFRDNPAAAVEVVQFLLDCDPSVKLQKYQGESQLNFACRLDYDDSNINAALAVIRVIYDFHPAAIEGNEIMTGVEDYHQEVQVFVLIQLGLARQAKVHRLMTTPDMNGQLPLHTALRNNSACFGSIKLLVKGDPSAVQFADNSGRLPLHIACMHYDSVEVIQYLVELDATTLDAVDWNGNTALHLACLGARYEAIALLLDEFDAVSVSKRNANEKLPIDLLWESNEAKDRESIEYTESIYRLLRANPEMIMGIDVQTMQTSASTATLPCQAGKKRKLGQ